LIRTIATRVSLLFALFALTLSSVFAADTSADLRKESITLLRDVQTIAGTTRDLAARLESYNRTPTQLTRTSHSEQWSAIKDEVNSMRPALVRLSEIRSQLPAAQRPAVDRILRSAQVIAFDTNTAIQLESSLDAYPALNPEYRKLVLEIYSTAGTMYQNADAGADYLLARERAVRTGFAAGDK